MAARKRVDPLKAKEAKQKKIAIGGMALLCLLLVVQGPKTLKMLKGPQAAPPAAAPAAPSPATPAPGTAAPAPTDGTAAPAAAAVDLSSLADSDLAPVAGDGQLVTFERFASKDPFVPQAVVKPSAPKPPADDSDGEAGDGAAPGKGDGATSSAVDGGFTPAPEDAAGGAPAPAAPALAALTSISVNGVAEDVEVEKTFPAEEPTFVLVSLAKDGKSVELGIAGGTYADGGQTIDLKLGKPLTLQNTADGTRYELELLAVAGFPVPKQKR